ncbi:hypothetical protein F3C99_05405 [Vitellibacter sp. q18]|nr:hypothetical protein [Aequorivita lutea]
MPEKLAIYRKYVIVLYRYFQQPQIMKIKIPTLWSVLAALFLATNVSYGQVGINTTTPNGILDVNSATYGVVLPRLALTATNVMAPATNPQGGNIPNGTVIYNTNTANVISGGINYSVSPGIYVWITNKWVPQFERKHSQLFESDLNFRPRSDAGFQTIPGLNNRSFTPKYTGTYRLNISVNYGGGNAKSPDKGTGNGRSDGKLNIAKASGLFRLNFGGTNYDIPAHAYSTAYDSDMSLTNYFAIWQEFYATNYITLTANTPVNFTLSFDQDDLPEFYDNGNTTNTNDSTDGKGRIAYDLPCTVELTYVGD